MKLLFTLCLLLANSLASAKPLDTRDYWVHTFSDRFSIYADNRPTVGNFQIDENGVSLSNYFSTPIVGIYLTF